MPAALLPIVLIASGCGGTRVAPRRPANTATVLMGVAPDSLDPAVAYTTRALEADWLVYTPLLTYDHATGAPGSQVIPGLAAAVPTVSAGGALYALTLRPGLTYSSGYPVRASDFTRAVERAIRVGWRGAGRFITPWIVGAAAYADGRAKTIRGISTDDATGQITIRLTAPWGDFENVLAFPALAPVPPGTPFGARSSSPPPGVGPYVIRDVVAGRTFALVRNPGWRREGIAQIPSGHLDIRVDISSDLTANALLVLDGTADVFASTDQIPVALRPRIAGSAKGRYSQQALNATFFVFLNVERKPFSSQLARRAVLTALDREKIKRLAAGTLLSGCYLLPPALYGHPHALCPYDSDRQPNLTLASALVKQSGMSGTRVTVWSEANQPFAAWTAYYAHLLVRLGFRVDERVLPQSVYSATISRPGLDPQTGFDEFYDAFPNPGGFYETLLDGSPRGNENWGAVDDPHLDTALAMLAPVPASKLSAVASFWRALDEFVAKRAYVAVLGYPTVPEFVSDRIDYRALVFSPFAGLDLSSVRLR